MIDFQDFINPLSVIPRAPEWPNLYVDPVDMKYFNYFLAHTKMFMPYTNLFPEAIDLMFARTSQSKPLRHAILALGSQMADRSLQRASPRSIYHKQEAIVSLQRSLTTNDIDENVAIAVFMLLFMDTFEGKAIVHAHLRGLMLVLKEIHADTEDGSVAYWHKLSPLLMLVWRIAMRVDSVVATTQQATPIFPPFPIEYNVLHRSWAQSLASDARTADLAVAAFALDNLYLRASHYRRNFEQGRRSQEYQTDPKIRATWDQTHIQHFKVVMREHASWLELPACTLGLRLELVAQQNQIACDATGFLDYPPVVINDRKFVILLNEWRSMYLYITIACMPDELRRHSLTSLSHAIEICRVHAALNLTRLSPEWSAEIFVLISASNGFGGCRKYQREMDWLAQQFMAIKKMRVPLLTRFQGFLDHAATFPWIGSQWEEHDLDWWDEPSIEM
jgi:Fungal specific transcription factor domain